MSEQPTRKETIKDGTKTIEMEEQVERLSFFTQSSTQITKVLKEHEAASTKDDKFHPVFAAFVVAQFRGGEFLGLHCNSAYPKDLVKGQLEDILDTIAGNLHGLIHNPQHEMAPKLDLPDNPVKGVRVSKK